MLKFAHIFRGLYRYKLGAILTGGSANIIIIKIKRLTKQINCWFLVKKENQNTYLERKTCQRRRKRQEKQLNLDIEMQVVSEFYQTKEGEDTRACGNLGHVMFSALTLSSMH